MIERSQLEAELSGKFGAGRVYGFELRQAIRNGVVALLANDPEFDRVIGLIDTGSQDHDVDGAFGGRDELLTNLSIYWFTQTAATAADSYAADGWGGEATRITVPTAMAIYPREAQSPRSWCERAANVVRYTTMPRGGHFAALEVPQDYAGDLLAFVEELG